MAVKYQFLTIDEDLALYKGESLVSINPTIQQLGEELGFLPLQDWSGVLADFPQDKRNLGDPPPVVPVEPPPYLFGDNTPGYAEVPELTGLGGMVEPHDSQAATTDMVRELDEIDQLPDQPDPDFEPYERVPIVPPTPTPPTDLLEMEEPGEPTNEEPNS